VKANQLFTLLFVLFLLYLWARFRKPHHQKGMGGFGVSATVSCDSLCLEFGFIHALPNVAPPGAGEVIISPMETSNCGIPLAADYLPKGTIVGYVPAASQFVQAAPCCQRLCYLPIINVEPATAFPIGVSGQPTVPETACVPKSSDPISTCIPSTGQI
jgi:hypothetical protein